MWSPVVMFPGIFLTQSRMKGWVSVLGSWHENNSWWTGSDVDSQFLGKEADVKGKEWPWWWIGGNYVCGFMDSSCRFTGNRADGLWDLVCYWTECVGERAVRWRFEGKLQWTTVECVDIWMAEETLGRIQNWHMKPTEQLQPLEAQRTWEVNVEQGKSWWWTRSDIRYTWLDSTGKGWVSGADHGVIVERCGVCSSMATLPEKFCFHRTHTQTVCLPIFSGTFAFTSTHLTLTLPTTITQKETPLHHKGKLVLAT